MKFSIITVCKNAGETIEATLKSVVGQTYKDVELVVIDGVSTDNTLEIVERYRDHIGVLISEPDTGIYNAMNKGIAHATGDIILFLNANDVLVNSNALMFAADKFLAYDAEIVFGDVLFDDKDKNKCYIRENNCFTHRFSFFYDNMCHQVIFYKRALFDRIGNYDERLRIYADYEFNMRAMIRHNVSAVYVNFVFSRFELGGISTAKNRAIRRKQKQEINAIMRRYYNPIELVFLFGRHIYRKNVPRMLNKINGRSGELNVQTC